MRSTIEKLMKTMTKRRAINKMDKIAGATCVDCGGCCCNLCYRNLGYFHRSFPGSEYMPPIGKDIYELEKRANKKFGKHDAADLFIYSSSARNIRLKRFMHNGMVRIAKKHGVKWSSKLVINNKKPEHELGFCGPEGCTIPREMRSYTCLSHSCNAITDDHFNGDSHKAHDTYEAMTMVILNEHKQGENSETVKVS